MQWIVKISLVLHVVAGVTALFVAPVAMALKKGGQGHRNWGLIFFWAMTVIFITALFLSTVQWSPFLLMIAVFSYYSVLSGYRWKFLKNLHRGQSVKWYDWGALVLNVTFNLSFITWGFFLAVKSDALGVAFLAMGFGLFGVFLSVDNLLLFLKPHAPQAWLYQHLGGMVGGFIATVTAFSSQFMNFIPEWLQWSWPSAIGIPLIFYWSASYRRKSKSSKTVASQ